MAEYNGKQGVWRTIGGRRVFIADGEDLATAMRNSGKFKNLKNSNSRTTKQVNKEYEELSKKMQADDYYYKPEDDRRLKELRAEYDTLVAQGQEDVNLTRYLARHDDRLPKKTEIKEQGTSNRKEVSENIQAHILEYYDGPQDFIDQMDALSNLPNNWKRGEELAKGGSYLIYNEDMSDFLDSLKINPKGKKFDYEKAFQMYTSLIGRESAKLYDRLKKKK